MKKIETPLVGDVWAQYAHVVTEDWEKLPLEAKILVKLTDATGKLTKATRLKKSAFTKIFFPATDALFQKTIVILRREIEQNAVWVVYGTPNLLKTKLDIGEEREKHFNIGVIERNYMKIGIIPRERAT